MPKPSKYFLPYQIKWLDDESKIKIWEKSRRIGATYVQSYEDVRDCVLGEVPAVWFSSADESAAKEYILCCAQWAKLFDAGARDLGEIVLDDKRNIKTHSIQFSNGRRINALSSNPKGFRSKGGKVIIDEYAHHDDALALWKAAKPTVTWGFPLCILSTHNTKQAQFYRFIKRVKEGKLNWSLHTTDIFKAVDEGLYDKISGRKTTEAERKKWLDELKADCFDDTTWLEEYCCIPVDEASAFLDYELISSCEEDGLMWGDSNPFNNYVENDLFVGVDIARKKHLTVIWINEKIANVKLTRAIIEIQNATFHLQKDILFNILSHPNVRRCCIDATGLGMQLSEEAQTAFGKYKVEAVTFSGKVKEEMAYAFRTDFEDRNIRIPSRHELREDLHSVRKVTTAANNIRFDVAQTEVAGHADRFWAAALCTFASKTNAGPLHVASGKRRKSYNILEGYDY